MISAPRGVWRRCIDSNGDGTFDIAWHRNTGTNFMWIISNARVTSETTLLSVAVDLEMYGLK